ncbi:hypothetical protein AJ80_01272 [Polytolypa hystricis UAMH7299]|uniref:Uncharacterized protein n=1 Tax=Polytolypa hystricis (strain UAMH7299) TaxID=1447883 RepID=A0A2B7Z0G2_POLH7|nr:hypothetical protein AJ80_01272 [Polytolypa hystricis UAMH7299]
MVSFDTVKGLAIFFAPIIIPRAISFYRSFRTSLRQRPPPVPLSTYATRATNILFFAAFTFLMLSLPLNGYPQPNIFQLTSSRFTTPTELLFSRLARLRPQGTLTDDDLLLKVKFGSPAARRLYLRFGSDPLLSCTYCSNDSPQSFILYYLPFHTLLPHLIHLLLLGLSTSAPLVGRQTSKWRNKFLVAAIAFSILDISIISTYDSLTGKSATMHDRTSTPRSLHNTGVTTRFLALSIFDAVCAGLIYLSDTNRLFYTPPSTAEQAEQLVNAAGTALASATSKLHALSVTRNAVVRDKALRARDDAYWRTVVAMEGFPTDSSSSGGGSIWEEEEVVRAMTRAMNNSQGGKGGVDVVKLGADANGYVDGVTAGLELADNGAK